MRKTVGLAQDQYININITENKPDIVAIFRKLRLIGRVKLMLRGWVYNYPNIELPVAEHDCRLNMGVLVDNAF